MKKPTQPTIAHDETHEVGELIGCPLWNCKSTNIPSKTKSYHYSPNSALAPRTWVVTKTKTPKTKTQDTKNKTRKLRPENEDPKTKTPYLLYLCPFVHLCDQRPLSAYKHGAHFYLILISY